jgi:ribonuclease Z
LKVVHLGTGDAFNYIPNNSHLIEGQTKILLDCGYNAVAELFKYNGNPEFLDAVFISHLHADHYFGISPLVTRFKDDNRSKKLTIICMKGNASRIRALMNMGYNGTLDKLTYELEFVEVESGDTMEFNEYKLSFAETIHPEANLAIRMEVDGKVICYSGDGKHTKESVNLYEDADLLIHEAFVVDGIKAGHTSIDEVLKLAKMVNAKKTALTHIRRKEVFSRSQDIINKCEEAKVNYLIPDAGDVTLI